MRDWKKGELQAFGAASKFLLFMGLLVAVLSWSEKDWLWVGMGTVMAVSGLALGIWLMRYQKRTGRSARPFSE